jgi:phospholipase/carboxylesterase
VNPHLETPPVVLGSGPATAVLLHGRGSGPQSMAGLAGALGVSGVRFVIPAAAGGTWYPQRFTAPVAANEPWLSWALEAVDAAVSSAAPGVVVAGFSQGACLALEYVARHPRRYAGVAALTGGLIGTDAELTRPAGLERTPVLLTTAEDDPWVPPGRTRATAAILEAAGAAVDLRVFPPGPHTVRPDEVAALRGLLG